MIFMVRRKISCDHLFRGQDHFVVAWIFFSVSDTSLFVAKIFFSLAEITFKVAVITSSVAKINFVVADIVFYNYKFLAI